jgi:mersacidin/lichenicidin family type 2 lantibiotic
MSRSDIIRAWKDAAFRKSLSEADRARLPANPAGTVELTEAEADAIEGRASYDVCSSTHCSDIAKF